MRKILLSVFIISMLSFSTLLGNEALIKDATNGNAEAQFRVAALYATGKLGNKTPEDRKKMFEWLEKSAEQNYLKAQETLCKQYLERGNYSGALKWAKKAMEQKSDLGKAVMAYLLYYGENVIPIDKTRAYTLIKECSSEPLAKSLLGLFYAEGWFDFEINYDKSIELAKEATKGNSSKAYALLGYVYLKQYSMEQDKNALKKMEDVIDEGLKINPFDIDLKIEKAMILLLFSESDESRNKGIEIVNECIKSGVKEANLILSEYELLIKKNNEKALEYIEKADNYYYSEDCYKLFDLYTMGKNSEGLKVDKNPKKAREIALKAISFNNQKFLEKYIPIYKLANLNPDLKKVLGEIYIDDFDCDKYIKIAADNGSPSMMYSYARMLAKKDEELKYLIGAANIGWDDAQGTLASKYFSEKEYEKACFWAKKAYDKNNFYGECIYGACMFFGYGGLQKDEEKGLELVLHAISKGVNPLILNLIVLKYYDDSNYYQTYFLCQICLKSAYITNSSFLKDSFNLFISDSKEKLSQEEIIKADNAANNIIDMNKKSQKNMIVKSLKKYGINNYRINPF